MPLYEFTCTKCGETFEDLVAVGPDHRAPACPTCGSEDVEKQVSRVASSGSKSGGSAGSPCGPGSGRFT